LRRSNTWVVASVAGLRADLALYPVPDLENALAEAQINVCVMRSLPR
jgi:hypothetical protein